MKRTKSSLLTFKLREFLDSKDATTTELPLPRIMEVSRPQRRVLTPRQAPQHDPDKVWVDCFFYGFYLEKSSLPAFQASLKAAADSAKKVGSAAA